jgi:hypothetical protein
MARAVNYRCDVHQDVFECPDNLIYYSLKLDAYGLIIHDGGTSFSKIDFCPWCGTKLLAANLTDERQAER